VVESEDVNGLWGATKNLEERQKVKIDAQKVEIFRLKGWKEWYAKKYRGVKERVAELEREIEKASEAHQETLGKQDQCSQAMADRLAQTEELLAVRSAELAVAQSFLWTTDGLSEAEVLDIVRDLNENIFQVAANLTEEWEKLGPSRANGFAVDQRDIDYLSHFHGPVLIQQALKRDPVAVTFLVQSCLCCLAMDITSSWRRNWELAELDQFINSCPPLVSTHRAQLVTGEMQLTYLLNSGSSTCLYGMCLMAALCNGAVTGQPVDSHVIICHTSVTCETSLLCLYIYHIRHVNMI